MSGGFLKNQAESVRWWQADHSMIGEFDTSKSCRVSGCSSRFGRRRRRFFPLLFVAFLLPVTNLPAEDIPVSKLVLVHQQAGEANYAAASARLEQLIQKYPDTQKGYRLFAQIGIAQGRTEAALDRLLQYSRQFPRQPGPYLGISMLLLEKEDFGGAWDNIYHAVVNGLSDLEGIKLFVELGLHQEKEQILVSFLDKGLSPQTRFARKVGLLYLQILDCNYPAIDSLFAVILAERPLKPEVYALYLRYRNQIHLPAAAEFVRNIPRMTTAADTVQWLCVYTEHGLFNLGGGILPYKESLLRRYAAAAHRFFLPDVEFFSVLRIALSIEAESEHYAKAVELTTKVQQRSANSGALGYSLELAICRGRIEIAHGNHVESLQYYQNALQLAKSWRNSYATKRVEIFLLETLYRIGAYSEARDLALRALETASKRGDLHGKINFQLMLIDLENALSDNKKAFVYCDSILNNPAYREFEYELLAARVILMKLYKNHHRWDDVETTYARASSQAKQLRSKILERKLELIYGFAALDAKNYRKAQQIFFKVFQDSIKPSGNKENLLLVLVPLGLISETEGNLKQASQYFQQALSISEKRIMAAEPSLETVLLEKYLSVFTESASFYARHGKLFEALQIAEKIHTLGLRQSLLENQNVVKPASLELINRPALAQREELASHAVFLKAHGLVAATDGRTSIINAKRLSTLQEKDLSSIQQYLARKNCSAIEFFLGTNKTLVFLVTPSSIRCQIIPAGRRYLSKVLREIAEPLGMLYDEQTQVNGRFDLGFNPVAAQKFYDYLLADLVDSLESKKLLIIPDHYLFNVPLDLLVVRKRGDSTAEFLGQRFAVHYAASLLAIVQAEQRTASYSGVFLAGQPDNAITSLQKELNDIKKSLSNAVSDIEVSIPVSPLQIVQEGKGKEIIHISGHAVFNKVDPFSSFLQLEPDELDRNGRLFMADIFQIDLPTGLVVLAACNTAYGRYQYNLNPRNFSFVLSIAGAKNVLATLWPIQDAPASEFICKFYQNLASGLSAAESLQQTRIAFLTEANARYADPYYWSAFVLYGPDFVMSPFQRVSQTN